MVQVPGQLPAWKKHPSQPKKVPSAIRKQVVERSAVMLPAAASITSGSTVEENKAFANFSLFSSKRVWFA